MGSSRFPGKPLAKINNIPMIGHVYFRSKMARILNEVYVATCDEEIVDYIDSINGKPIMTSKKHQRASDRTAEALINIENQTGKRVDIVVMLQGDEPMILPQMIEAALDPLIKSDNINVSNLMSELSNEFESNDPNEVKVVVDNECNALYFSREPIPSTKKYNSSLKRYKQVCIIPFKRDCLFEYTKLDPTPLEIIESIDMNRFLEYGINVKMVQTDHETFAVDTPQDLQKVEEVMSNDKLISKYFIE